MNGYTHRHTAVDNANTQSPKPASGKNAGHICEIKQQRHVDCAMRTENVDNCPGG